MKQEEYDALDMAEKVNYCERAVSLLCGELKKHQANAESDLCRSKKDMNCAVKEAHMPNMVRISEYKHAAELKAQTCKDILFRFKCWQDHSSANWDQLPLGFKD